MTCVAIPPSDHSPHGDSSLDSKQICVDVIAATGFSLSNALVHDHKMLYTWSASCFLYEYSVIRSFGNGSHDGRGYCDKFSYSMADEKNNTKEKEEDKG